MKYQKREISKYLNRKSLTLAVFWLMMFGCFVTTTARSQSFPCINAIYFTSSNNTNIYRYQPGTNAITRLNNMSLNYGFSQGSAAAALTPDGNRLYYNDRLSPRKLRYNIGNNNNPSVGTQPDDSISAQRNGIDPNGVGYFMLGSANSGTYYRYTTGGASSTITSGTLTVQPATAPALGNGGDFAFDSNGIAYLLDQNKNFYRLDFTGNIANYLGTVTGMGSESPNGVGFALTNSGAYELYVSTLDDNLYKINLATMAATLVTPSSIVSGFTQNDIASCIYPPGIVPNVAATKAWRNITKGDPNTFSTSTAASVGDTLEYRVVVRNTGVIGAGNVTFQDAIPSGFTYVSNSTTLNGASVTDNAGTGNARFYYGSAKSIQGYGQAAGSGVIGVDSTPGTLTDDEAVVVFRVTVNNPFNGTANPVLNTAQVVYAGPLPGGTTTVNSNQTQTPVLVADLSVAKSQRQGTSGTFQTTPLTVNQNGIVEYQLLFTNNGMGTVANAALADNVPSNLTGLSVVSATGANGATACAASFAAAPNQNNLSGNFSGPSGATCTVLIRGTASTAGTLTNTATTAAPSGTSDSNTGNNSSSVTTVIISVADLSVVKSQRQGTTGTFQTSSLTVVPGNVVQYRLVFTNLGPAPTLNAALSDNVPSNLTGLSVVSATGAAGATTCTASFAVAPNQNNLTGSFSGLSGATCTVIIQGTASTAGSVTNTARITPADILAVADLDCSGSPVVCAGNNVSSVTTVISALYTISGSVFEDVNYAGGAGRSLATSSGVGRGSARVELYNSTGAYVTAITSASDGSYSFTNLAAGNYTVRVVNSTVSSSRSGYVASLIGVQTFRTNGGSADVNRVGGENPAKIDAAANTTSATLASLTTSSATAQSIGTVAITTGNIADINFGYNFDTIVNVNDAGQGSLRQFITNANALSGADTTIFMISDGAAHAGLANGLPNQLTGGVAVITLASLLPAVTDSNTTVSGATQTNNVGNTNSGSLGAGGSVGVGNLTLSAVSRPEVQITDGATNLAVGLNLQAANAVVRGISIFGFGTAANSDSSANILMNTAATSALIEGNIIGSTATGFADPGAGVRSVGDTVRSVGATNGTLRNNLIGFSEGKGFGVEAGSTGWTIENNEIRGNGINNSNLDGIDLESSSTTNNTVRGNLIINNEGVGVDSYQSNGSNTIVNNTITNNGIGPNSNVETPGVRLYGANNLVDRNIIYANYGAGVMITSGSTSNTITRNSIYANGTIGAAPSGQIGIDLHTGNENTSTGSSTFVTVNDAGDTDGGANGGLNFPVLETAQIVGGNLILQGFSRPGATIEFFVAAPDASGFGEGQTYLVTLFEGAGVDTDATTATYTSPFNGKNVGTDTTNRFNFTLAVPSGVANGTVLTATATLDGATSEFSNTISVGAVVAPPSIGLVKSVTPNGTQTPGTDLTYTINFSNNGGQGATNFTITDPNPAVTTLKLNNDTDFKVGSVVNALGTTGLTATVTYSNDNGATYTYTPVSAGGGAPAGYDRNVTHIRWAFSGSLSQTAPNNAGSVSFIVRIR